MATAGEINANELYLVAGDGGGSLLVETEYAEITVDNNQVFGYKTLISADDIVAAYLSGKHVAFHFPEYNDGNHVERPEACVTLYGYNKAYQWGTEQFHHDYQAISWWCETFRTSDDKLMFKIYVD